MALIKLINCNKNLLLDIIFVEDKINNSYFKFCINKL